jgi:hypothetical protein
MSAQLGWFRIRPILRLKDTLSAGLVKGRRLVCIRGDADRFNPGDRSKASDFIGNSWIRYNSVIQIRRQ